MALDFNNMSLADQVQFLQYVGQVQGLDPRVIDQQVRDVVANAPFAERVAFSNYLGIPAPTEPAEGDLGGLDPYEILQFGQSRGNAEFAHGQGLATLEHLRNQATSDYNAARHSQVEGYNEARANAVAGFDRAIEQLMENAQRQREHFGGQFNQRGLLNSGIQQGARQQFEGDVTRQQGYITDDRTMQLGAMDRQHQEALAGLLRNYNTQLGNFSLQGSQLDSTLGHTIGNIDDQESTLNSQRLADQIRSAS